MRSLTLACLLLLLSCKGGDDSGNRDENVVLPPIHMDRVGTEVHSAELPPQIGSTKIAVPEKPPIEALDYLLAFNDWDERAFPPVPFGRIKFSSLDEIKVWIESTASYKKEAFSVWGGKTKVRLDEENGDYQAVRQSKKMVGVTEYFFATDYWVYVVWSSTKYSPEGKPILGKLWEDSKPVMYAWIRRPRDEEAKNPPKPEEGQVEGREVQEER